MNSCARRDVVAKCLALTSFAITRREPFSVPNIKLDVVGRSALFVGDFISAPRRYSDKWFCNPSLRRRAVHRVAVFDYLNHVREPQLSLQEFSNSIDFAP